MKRLLIHWIVTLLLTLALTWLLPSIFAVGGGLRGIIVVGSILFLLNALVRIALQVLLFPFRLVFGLIVMLFINAFLLWLAEILVAQFSPNIVTFQVQGGIAGWFIAACVFGIASWIERHVFQEGHSSE